MTHEQKCHIIDTINETTHYIPSLYLNGYCNNNYDHVRT